MNSCSRFTSKRLGIHVSSLTVIGLLILILPASGAECPNGTYNNDDLYQYTTSAPGTDFTEMTTVDTARALECRNCSDNITHCELCNASHATGLQCLKCYDGYELKSNKCSKTSNEPSPSNNAVIIGVVVGVVGGLLVIAGVVLLIIFLVRRGYCKNCKKEDLPPMIPAPDQMTASFTQKKDDQQQSGTGQRVDLRYTGEPGPTQGRVQSVQYDEFVHKKKDQQDDLYMNTPQITEEDENDPDQLYENTQPPTKKKQTRNTSPAVGGPPKTKPKPKRGVNSSPAVQSPSDDDHIGSNFSPKDDQVYYNNPDADEGEQDDDDYVNAGDVPKPSW